MKKIQRTPAPAWFKDHGKWGELSQGDRNKLLYELAEMTRYHCSFCDENLLGKQFAAIQFRPKIKFPAKVFEWENMFLCCPNCDDAKGIKFDENLLKPDEDEYEFDKYFRIDFSTGNLLPNPEASRENRERARITIDTFRLNSYDRPGARLGELRKYRDIGKYDDSTIHYYSYRFFIKRGENVNLPGDPSGITVSPKIGKIRVEYITIRNIKCFEDVKITFNPTGNTTLIIGNNSRGKSLILQLLGLGLNEVRSVPFTHNWKKVVKTGKKVGTFEIALRLDFNPDSSLSETDTMNKSSSSMNLKLEFQIGEDDTITCMKTNDDWKELRYQLLLIGYGVNRNIRLEEPPPYKEIGSVATLFGENSYLKHIKASGTFNYVKKKFYTIRDIINDILDKADDEHKILLEGYDPDSFYFSTPSNPDESIPIEALSEGFKSTFVWLSDMIVRAIERNTDDAREAAGVILLDEIDLHLHPTWQRRILPSLEETFPNIQFIATTHSPFVAQSAESLIELELDENGNQVNVADKMALPERSYNAIVREDFNIPSPFSYDTEKEMVQFRKIRDAIMKEEKVDEGQFKKLVLKLAEKGTEIEGVMRREVIQLERHTGRTFDL